MRILVIGLGPYTTSCRQQQNAAERLSIPSIYSGGSFPRRNSSPEANSRGWVRGLLVLHLSCRLQNAGSVARWEWVCVCIQHILLSSLLIRACLHESCGGTSHFNFLSRPPKIYTHSASGWLGRCRRNGKKCDSFLSLLYEKLRIQYCECPRGKAQIYIAHGHKNSYTHKEQWLVQMDRVSSCSALRVYLEWAQITVLPQPGLIECFFPAANFTSLLHRCVVWAKNPKSIFCERNQVWCLVLHACVYKVGCVLRFAFSIFLTSAARPQIAVNAPALERKCKLDLARRAHPTV